MSEKLSILAQFDDLCRDFNYFNSNNCNEEFLAFARYQEQCRQHWLEVEKEARRLQAALADSEKKNSKLQMQLQHVTTILRDEVKHRQILEKEKKALEKRLTFIKDVISTEHGINNETKEKLVKLGSTNQHAAAEDYESPGNRLETINELNSTGSILSSFDMTCDRTDEELEASAVRSYRDVRKKGRRSSRGRSVENALDVGGRERIVATTVVTVPESGPVRATSTIQAVPEEDEEGEVLNRSRKRKSSEPSATPSAPPKYIIEDSEWEMPGGKTPVAVGRFAAKPSLSSQSSVATLRTMSSGGRINQRQHVFVTKTILKQENCVACNNRIRFGKTVLKCTECRATCHVDCRSRMPMPCVPTVQTPTTKNFVGIIADYAPSTAPMIPAIVIHCINEVERRGLTEVGLYRVNGSEREVRELKDILLKGKGQPQLWKNDIHSVTGALKSFFRGLREPLITYTAWDSFVRAAEMDDPADSQAALIAAIADLPQPNRDTLAYLILHLQRVASSNQAKMPLENLAKMFGPTIIGTSCPDPDSDTALKQLKKQILTMEKLLLIPCDYWNRIVSFDSGRDSFLTPHSDRYSRDPYTPMGAYTPGFFRSPHVDH